MGSRGFWLSMIWVGLAVLPIFIHLAIELYDEYKFKRRANARK